MDFLQLALIFLIVILSVFLSITGFQVFLILRDMKKTLDKVNSVLFGDERSSEKLKSIKKNSRPTSPTASPRRFFKKGF